MKSQSKYVVEQSEVTKVWYVRDSETGQIFEERETKQGATLAAARRNASLFDFSLPHTE